jgi:uncharacterized protein (TIRG00374 family)
MFGVQADSTRRLRRRRRLRKEVKWTLSAIILVLVVEIVVLPRLGGFSHALTQVAHINVGYVAVGVALEAAALIAYAQLTFTVLPPGGPRLWRLLRINLSSLALSHVMPGGTAPGVGLSYRLLSQSGVRSADAGFALAMQGVGSAVVLNVLFLMALIVSVFTRGYHPLYTVAALAGVVLMLAFAAVIVALTKGRRRTVEVAREWANRVPFLDGDRLAVGVQRVAERLRMLADDRQLLWRAIVWAAANWLLDAASLWVFIAAFHHYISPIDLLVAYGLANILAVIPITPGGLGVVEGVLIPALHGFGVPLYVAGVAVLGYRLANFWLPIPIGGGTYLSLRFERVGWRQRLHEAHEEIVVQPEPAGSDDAKGSPGYDTPGSPGYQLPPTTDSSDMAGPISPPSSNGSGRPPTATSDDTSRETNPPATTDTSA